LTGALLYFWKADRLKKTDRKISMRNSTSLNITIITTTITTGKGAG